METPHNSLNNGEEPINLWHCDNCESDLVYPTDWDEVGTTHWDVICRCPECENVTEGIYEQDAVDRFDEELDRGAEAVARDLRRLERANAEDEIRRFAGALVNNHILPEDF